MAATFLRSQPAIKVGVAAGVLVSATGTRFSVRTTSTAAMSTVKKAETGRNPAASAVAKAEQKKALRTGARDSDSRMVTSDWLGSRQDVFKTQLHHRHRLFDSLAALFPFATSFAPSPMQMNLYLSSTTKAYTVRASMPGMNRSDFNITVDGGVLRIEAERNEQRIEDVRPSNSPTASLPLPPAQAAVATAAMATTKGETVRDKDTSSDGVEAKQSQRKGAGAEEIEQDMGESAHGDDDVTVHYGESFFGRVEQSLELPEDANFISMTAKYRDGVLEIVVPRQQRDITPGQKIIVQ